MKQRVVFLCSGVRIVILCSMASNVSQIVNFEDPRHLLACVFSSLEF